MNGPHESNAREARSAVVLARLLDALERQHLHGLSARARYSMNVESAICEGREIIPAPRRLDDDEIRE